MKGVLVPVTDMSGPFNGESGAETGLAVPRLRFFSFDSKVSSFEVGTLVVGASVGWLKGGIVVGGTVGLEVGDLVGT